MPLFKQVRADWSAGGDREKAVARGKELKGVVLPSPDFDLFRETLALSFRSP
jgi:hypothetical protein